MRRVGSVIQFSREEHRALEDEFDALLKAEGKTGKKRSVGRVARDARVSYEFVRDVAGRRLAHSEQYLHSLADTLGVDLEVILERVAKKKVKEDDGKDSRPRGETKYGI